MDVSDLADSAKLDFAICVLLLSGRQRKVYRHKAKLVKAHLNDIFSSCPCIHMESVVFVCFGRRVGGEQRLQNFNCSSKGEHLMSRQEEVRSATEMIVKWARNKPKWQQEAVRRVVGNVAVTDEDIAEILLLCKSEYGSEKSSLNVAPLETEDIQVNSISDSSMRLVSVSNVVGVNQLASKQIIDFEIDGLTIIYGQNGTGKSGYARILKRSCGARHATKILSNIYTESNDQKATAKIKILIGMHPEIVDWEDSNVPNKHMALISVLDKHCADVQIQQETEIIFMPFGLDIPHKLVSINKKLEEIVGKEIELLNSKKSKVFLSPTWSRETKVGLFMESLTADSNMEELEKLGHLTGDEQKRMQMLSRSLERNPVELANIYNKALEKAQKVYDAVEKVIKIASDDNLKRIKERSDVAREKRLAATLVADSAFGDFDISGIGKESWRSLWEAARRYAESDAYLDKKFPPKDDALCVLCLTPLDGAAISRMNSFEEFVRNDTHQQASDAEMMFKDHLVAFENDNANLKKLFDVCRRNPARDQELNKVIKRTLAAARLRVYECKKALKCSEEMRIREWPELPIKKLEKVICDLRVIIKKTNEAADPKNRNDVENEYCGLVDRSTVSDLVPVARKEVDRLKKVAALSEMLKHFKTGHITNLGNDIADMVVTSKMESQFKKEIHRITKGKINVKLARAGGKFGSPYYKIQLSENPRIAVEGVLSEGEQTIVAIAGFLSELSNASHSSALVFDDPVSSLDHRWRKGIAKRVAEESLKRQVVVFSHDLVFVRDMEELAKKANVKVKTYTLKKTQNYTGVVELGLPWQWREVSKRVGDLKKKAQKIRNRYEKGKIDEEQFKESAQRIYSRLRATWERAIEDVAFCGVVNRYRDYIDTRSIMKVTVLDERDCRIMRDGFKKCSDLIDAHDTSLERGMDEISPDEIVEDIVVLEKWIEKVREKQRLVGN